VVAASGIGDDAAVAVGDGDDHCSSSHFHDVANAAGGGGKDGHRHGRLDNSVSVALNCVRKQIEKMLAKEGSYLMIDMTIVDVRYVR